MWTFKREYAFLLGLKDTAQAMIARKGLQWFLRWIVFFYHCNLARCQYKHLSAYRSWSEFIERRLDPIWLAERWERCDILWPCEGLSLDVSGEQVDNVCKEFLPEPFQILAGIERSDWDICWIRAPIDLIVIQTIGCWKLYRSPQVSLYFFVYTENPSRLKNMVKAGEEMGRLIGRSKVYIVEKQGLRLRSLQCF